MLRCAGISKEQIRVSRAAHVCQAIGTRRGGRQKWKCASTFSCHAILPSAATTPLISVAGAGSGIKEGKSVVFWQSSGKQTAVWCLVETSLGAEVWVTLSLHSAHCTVSFPCNSTSRHAGYRELVSLGAKFVSPEYPKVIN